MAIPIVFDHNELKEKLGWVPDESLVSGSQAGGADISYSTTNGLCYMGPCTGGRRTVCYSTPTGCNNCGTTSYGC
jgi:hypothetical protein